MQSGLLFSSSSSILPLSLLLLSILLVLFYSSILLLPLLLFPLILIPSFAPIYQEPLLFLAGLLPDHFTIPPMKAPLPEDESVCLFCIGKLIAVMDKHVQDSNSDISLATMTAFLLALQRNFGGENKLNYEVLDGGAHRGKTLSTVDIEGVESLVDSGLSGVHVVKEGIQSIDLIIASDVLPDQSEGEGAVAEGGVAYVGVLDAQEVEAIARTGARTTTDEDDELSVDLELPVHEHGVNETTVGIYESDLQEIEKEIEKEIENETVLTDALEVEVEVEVGALPEPNGIAVIRETSDAIVGGVKTADSAVPELPRAASVNPLRSMVHPIPTVMSTLFILLFLLFPLLVSCSVLSF